MDTKIQFQKDATILTADGQPVGSLNRLVVNPNTKVLTDIVVRTGSLFNQQERVVPIEMITETTEDQIVLSEEAGDLNTFPAFEEERIVDTEENMRDSSTDVSVQTIIYGAPVFGVPLQTTIGERFVTKIDQNIPKGSVAMKEGAKVISADGKHVGNVERVFTDLPDEQITELLISQGAFKKTLKLVPVEWVKDVNEEEVNLLVHKISIDALEEVSEMEVR